MWTWETGKARFSSQVYSAGLNRPRFPLVLSTPQNEAMPSAGMRLCTSKAMWTYKSLLGHPRPQERSRKIPHWAVWLCASSLVTGEEVAFPSGLSGKRGLWKGTRDQIAFCELASTTTEKPMDSWAQGNVDLTLFQPLICDKPANSICKSR